MHHGKLQPVGYKASYTTSLTPTHSHPKQNCCGRQFRTCQSSEQLGPSGGNQSTIYTDWVPSGRTYLTAKLVVNAPSAGKWKQWIILYLNVLYLTGQTSGYMQNLYLKKQVSSGDHSHLVPCGQHRSYVTANPKRHTACVKSSWQNQLTSSGAYDVRGS